MKTITSTENIEIKVAEDELINKEWLSFALLSKKLADKEQENQSAYKTLRVRLYNSDKGNKLNIATIAGVKCINVDSPMKTQSSSLVLTFVRS